MGERRSANSKERREGRKDELGRSFPRDTRPPSACGESAFPVMYKTVSDDHKGCAKRLAHLEVGLSIASDTECRLLDVVDKVVESASQGQELAGRIWMSSEGNSLVRVQQRPCERFVSQHFPKNHARIERDFSILISASE